MLADQTRTTAEVAAILEISEAAVRKLVQRRRLAPVRRGARPLKFRALDVEKMRAERENEARQAEVASLYAEVDALTAR
jgi:hypothetical protein